MPTSSRLALLLTCALAVPPVIGQEVPAPDFLSDYAATYRYQLGTPQNVRIVPDGSAVLFLRSGPRSFVRDMFLFEPETGEERPLLSASALLGGEEEELSPEERARRERERLVAGGIARFELSSDGESLLVPISDRLFVVRWRSGEVVELPSPGYPIAPRFSPDGSRVGCVVDGDLWVLEIATGESRRLTFEAETEEAVTWGLAEFVAQEEMDRSSGFWWSPDGTRLAVQRTDTSALERFHIADPMAPEKPVAVFPYPRAGRANADVRLAILDRAGGEPVWVEWDRGRYPYLARLVWETERPMVLVQDRSQTEELLLSVDPATGSTETLLVERDGAWLNLDPPGTRVSEDRQLPRPIPGRDAFLWATERRGAWQLEIWTADGRSSRALTPSEIPYQGFVALDAASDSVYVLASDEPTETHLYRVSLEPDAGPPERLSGEGGLAGAVIDGGLEVRQLGGRGTGRPVEVRRLGGELLGELQSTRAEPPFEAAPELLTVGTLGYRTSVVRPRGREAGQRYPVLVAIYGGPGSQEVHRKHSYLLDQWIADHGFVVVRIDGRGTPNRGRAWERAIRGDFFTTPLADQVAALEGLAERIPEMDLSRVGIFGWSFGGYASAMAVLRRPDIFDAAVVGAPVTDWRDYDTHYTERYIGLPDEAPEAYEVSSVLTYADRLEKPLLIVHGTADDNVYFLHALKMSNAFFRAGKPHGFLPLAGLTHMVPDPEVTQRQYELIVGFLSEALGAIEN